jgi:acyl-CoA synthetase (AMP-forming)/AMP-acid ligase II
MPWLHNYSAVGHSLSLTAMVAAFPIFFLFWALAYKRMKGYVAASSTLFLMLLVAVTAYGMPARAAVSAAILGMVSGLWPIGWIILTAVFFYNLTVEAGQSGIIQSSISSVSRDRRLQALLIAFCFSAFLEGVAGEGAPVAVAAAMLIGLGFKPLPAAVVCLLANTPPVPFGPVGVPTSMMISVTAAETIAPIDGEDVALLMFTAGTTSAPKVVPLTHRNLVASVHSISSGYDLSPQDATLIVMPLFHGHGLVAGLLATLASGGSAYLPSTGGFSAHLFWPDVVRLGVTWYTAVPTIHSILVNRASKEYPSSSPVRLRFIRSCSAPLDEELATAMIATFRAPVISAYGMTEASHQVSSNPLPVNGSIKTSSVGLPTGVEIRIVAEDGKDAATGSVGEIWVRGATVTTGYLNNAEANSASFVDGWFRSGDLGSVDADGYLHVRGRLKEIINRGGEKISPGDIDAALLSNPKVLEAASFGESDAIYGENVQAAVILRSGTEATERELRDYCRTRLSAFEVPERIYIVADFPRTAKGSTDRRALAAQFTAGGGSERQ